MVAAQLNNAELILFGVLISLRIRRAKKMLPPTSRTGARRRVAARGQRRRPAHLATLSRGGHFAPQWPNLSRRAIRNDMRPLKQIIPDRHRIEGRSAQPNVSVGAEKKERRVGDVRAQQLFGVCGGLRGDLNSQEIAEAFEAHNG